MIKNYLLAAMFALPLVFTSSVVLAKKHEPDKKHQVHEKKSSHKKSEKKQQSAKKHQHNVKHTESKHVNKPKAKDKHACVKNCGDKTHVETKKVVTPAPAAIQNEPATKTLAPLPELPKIDTPDSSMGKLINQSATDAKQDARQKLSNP